MSDSPGHIRSQQTRGHRHILLLVSGERAQGEESEEKGGQDGRVTQREAFSKSRVSRLTQSPSGVHPAVVCEPSTKKKKKNSSTQGALGDGTNS